MNKKSIIILAILAATISLAALVLTGFNGQAVTAAPSAPEAWFGAWQLSPDIPTDLLGCNAGDGLGRLSGVYSPEYNRIFFLGGRCETDTITTGAVFFFDLNDRTYYDTGVEMPVPVSNYQLAVIEDDGTGNGPGYYIAGGRLANGVQTNATQVYYPDENTAVQILTDPFPPGGGAVRTPGGVVGVNNKMYAFGGFDGAVTYDETYVYDPMAAAGSRWTNLGHDLPTARSYISTVAVGNQIYAMGGDEFTGGSLVPLNDTLVLDLDNLAAGWQDDLMADMPAVNGDAPAVYVDEGYLGGDAGGIFVIGGSWPAPGPYRWVFRYDIATDTWDDTFPELAVPDPATGRRNQAAVYVPVLETAGLGDGQPGIWTFGGYDGSGTNAMTNTSEYFSIDVNAVLVLPYTIEQTGVPGTMVTHDMVVLNLSVITDTYDLSYTSDVTWTVDLPATVGPVGIGAEGPFSMDVFIPESLDCGVTGVFTVTATSQVAPLTDSQAVRVRSACGVGGMVTDATTGEPVENSYVWIQNTIDGLDVYFDAYTDADGNYTILDIPLGDYYMGASAKFHQPSFYSAGWPDGATQVTIDANGAAADFVLVSSQMEWSPGGFDVALSSGEQTQETLTISNTGTGPLWYFISAVEGDHEIRPSDAALPVEGMPRVDPQLAADMTASADGTADFVVVLDNQADLSAAYIIKDWHARGEYVYNTLRQHAQLTQANMRQYLDGQAVDYTPLYIINGIIVRGGDQTLVNALAARPDVAQIVANHRIAVEEPVLAPPEAAAPDAIEWNITKVKAPNVWNEYGVTGEGTVVAEIDTGTQWDHPALINQYRGWDGTAADHNYNWFDPYGQSPDEPNDEGQHGTHVMGTMVGDDGAANQIGMAPGAKWISCKGGDDVSGYLLTNELLQCAEWILAPWDLAGDNSDANPDMRPHVVNNSWGGGNGDYWFTGAIDAWRAAGIFPQFSNGNSGPACSTAGSPGDNWNAFSAGATTTTDAIASFSSRGPSANHGYLKPDISAPGASIRSSIPGGIYQGGWSGTSMASPHVAGAIALLWSSNPELIGQIELSGWLLQQTATPLTTNEGSGGDGPAHVPNNTFGYGRLDIYAAVTAARSGGVTAEWLTAAPWGGEVLPGESADVTLNFDATLLNGTYTAILWLVADDPYNNDVRLPVQLSVTADPPVAGFTSDSPVFLSDPMVFTNTTTGSEPISYLWDFGDTFTSTLTSPTHTYAAVGDYTVVLTATNFLDSDVFSATVSILQPELPVAEFESNSPITFGETAVFTNTSTGDGALAFLWDFGDFITTTLESPMHIYEVAGTYTVTLSVTSPYGVDAVAHPFVVQVAAPPEHKLFLPVVMDMKTEE